MRRMEDMSRRNDPHIALLLPAFYAALDPTTIPSPGDMDTVWQTMSEYSQTHLVIGPMLSLTCLDFDLDIPVAALPELWPRTMAW